jgi:hypothetical protein
LGHRRRAHRDAHGLPDRGGARVTAGKRGGHDRPRHRLRRQWR